MAVNDQANNMTIIKYIEMKYMVGNDDAWKCVNC